eukprot:3690900-Rhodomonas_salina.1
MTRAERFLTCQCRARESSEQRQNSRRSDKERASGRAGERRVERHLEAVGVTCPAESHIGLPCARTLHPQAIVEALALRLEL